MPSAGCLPAPRALVAPRRRHRAPRPDRRRQSQQPVASAAGKVASPVRNATAVPTEMPIVFRPAAPHGTDDWVLYGLPERVGVEPDTGVADSEQRNDQVGADRVPGFLEAVIGEDGDAGR